MKDIGGGSRVIHSFLQFVRLNVHPFGSTWTLNARISQYGAGTGQLELAWQRLRDCVPKGKSMKLTHHTARH